MSPEELLDAHPGATVLTLDFFDTLITRSVAQPTHVFAAMEEELVRVEGDKWRGFAVRRVMAERRARQSIAHDGTGADITLDDIMRELAADLDLSMSGRERLAVLECDTEVSHAVAVPFGRALIAAAVARGMRVVVVSDNYMASSHLVRMAGAAGIDITGLEVYVSCEHGAMKHDGGLWKVVLAGTGVSPAEVLHVGDLDDADGTVPARLGIAVHVEGSMRRSHREPLNTCPALLPLSRMEAAQRDRYVGAAWDCADNLARGALAIVTAAQVHDVATAARERGAVAVHFLARDGENAKWVYDRLRDHDPSLPPATYTAVSRSMMWRASLREVTPATVARFIGEDELLTPSRVAARFGCSFGPAGTGDTVLDVPAARDLVLAHSSEVEAACAALRSRLLAYLDASGVTAAGHHVVMDLGWTGSVVTGLAELVRAERPGTSFEGRLTAMYWDATPNRCRLPLHGLALDEFGSMDDNVRLLGAIRFLEPLLSAEHGTVVDYLDGQAVLTEEPGEPVLPGDVLAKMHSSIRQAAVDIVLGRHPLVGPADLTRDTVWASIMQVAHTPTAGEVALLSGARHDTDVDHAGGGVPLIRTATVDAQLEDVPGTYQSLLHDNWAQGTLENWGADPGTRWLADEIRRHAPMMRPQWVMT